MTIDNSVNDLLEGGGTALKFPTIGTTHKGTIISATKSQVTDPKTRAPKTFDDGRPMEQIICTLQTEYRDDPTDDGIRRLFIQSGMIKAVREALRAANAKLESGGTLAVQYYADGEPTVRGFSPPKMYRAQYKPPSVAQAANDLLSTNGPSSATWAADPGVPATPTAGADPDFDPFTDK